MPSGCQSLLIAPSISLSFSLIAFTSSLKDHLSEPWINEGSPSIVEGPANAKTLQYVQMIWRHGDRTPAVLIPTDKDNDEFTWPEGLGELTDEGVAQQYRLGKWLRERYQLFLGDKFMRNQVHVRSSDVNRTLMSAQANLAGLFPPAKDNQLDGFLAFLSEKTGIADFHLQKMWLVFDPLNSEHDTTVANILASFGIFPVRFPLYATAVLIELHRVNGEDVIEIYHKNETDSSVLFKHEIEACPSPCKLETIMNIMKPYDVSDTWKQECGLLQPDHTSRYITAIAALATSTLLLAAFIVVDILLKYRRTDRTTGDSRLLMDSDNSLDT